MKNYARNINNFRNFMKNTIKVMKRIMNLMRFTTENMMFIKKDMLDFIEAEYFRFTSVCICSIVENY